MIRVGLIGAGKMGAYHARSLMEHPQTQLLWVVDTHADRAKKLASTWGVSAADQVEEGADLIVIATPASTHAEVARPFVGQTWLLIEKPLDARVRSAETLVSPRSLASQPARYHGALRSLSTPQHAKIWRECVSSPRCLDTDVIYDLMIHDLDLLRAWHPDLALVNAYGDIGEHGIERATALFQWAGGEGTLHVSRVAHRPRRRAELDQHTIDLAIHPAGPDPLTAQLDAVCTHIHTGTGAITARFALETLRLADAIRSRIA